MSWEKTAQSCKHGYIGTEHILIGLLKEKKGTAGMVLEEFGVEEERLLALIEKLIAPPDTGTAVAERAPEYSPRARKIINNAAKESEIRHGKGIGTEHLMIAVLKETDCVANQTIVYAGSQHPEAVCRGAFGNGDGCGGY